jgi:predicted PurR-regulated permease PerM
VGEVAARTSSIERSLLTLLVLGLVIGVVAVVWPFTTAILFGASLATAAWPLRQALIRRARLRRGVAAAVLLLGSLAFVGIPVFAIAPSLTDQVRAAIATTHEFFVRSPPPPAWMPAVPLFGDRLATGWNRMVETGGNLRAASAPYASDIQHWLLAAAGALADSVLQLLLALAVATMFWSSGEGVVAVLYDALRRLGGATAARMLDVAALAIRGVAYGIVGTALIQAILLTIGLFLAGVPGAGMLGFIGFLLAISQIGAPLIILIWGGAAWWLFSHDYQAWGIFMIVWGLFVSTIDNFVKPWLIGFGIEMPLVLTILGVFGGFMTFGFLGMFIGPVMIGVFFTLLQAWRSAEQSVAD